MTSSPRGFTLLISILIATVAVTLGVTLLDLSYKQVVLSSTAKQSQFGFYAADAALECALYLDQKFNAFSYTSAWNANQVSCHGNQVLNYSSPNPNGAPYRKTDFYIRCGSTNTSNGKVTVYKYSTGDTTIYANGFSTCSDTDPRRVERGLKVFY